MGVVLWMLGALLSLSLMAVGARELAGEINTFQTLFIRSVIGLLIISALIARVGGRSLFATSRPGMHIIRNLFHFGGQYGWFVGIGLLPLAEVFALEFTVPFWVALIAALCLGERLTIRKSLAIALGVAGVLVILRPGVEILEPASLIVLAAALSFSCAYVGTKSLAHTEDPLTVLFYMCLVQMPVSLVLALPHWQLPEEPRLWFWLVIVGVTALSAHFCITNAMKRAEAGIVVTLDFLRLPLIGLVGIVFYQEPFEMALLAGALLMLGGNLINVYRPRYQRELLAVVRDKERDKDSH
ncbi:DMT family transporter [Porticoccus litoralis]|uniref:DMT family transporter n=1 Tax=Porticoccus litoralis TaxID=434086 RepID=A0AAW8AVS5_9GAMM|nr:DMT family transporter [Porticoccus litoralis]MDP1519381.1 DMT family transporter [Porticoccus litoralis]